MKAGIYCRLSEEDRNKQNAEDDSNSIQNQKSMLIQYAMDRGWEIYGIYSDDDYTGSDRGRPAFNELLEDAKRRRFDIVLCKTQSRFTRELELVEKYIHGLFPAWGIRFIGVVDNADTDNKGNKKSRQINGLVNEWYLEDMSENIRSVLAARRKEGFHIGAFALFGYVKDPRQKGRLLIDDEAAAVVRTVFTLFSQGYGKSQIARILNGHGIPNPTEYKRLHGLRYQTPKTQSTLWKYFSIAHMLTNEMYIGNMVQGKYGSVSYKTKQNRPRPKELWYRVEGTHEPIVDRALWDRVQELVARRAKPFAAGEVGIFARKARCASCGYVMSSSKNGVRRYLQCPNHLVSHDACPGAFLSYEKLEQAVLAELKRLLAEYLDKEALANGLACRTGPGECRERLAAELSACQKKLADYAKSLRELYFDKTRGIVSESDYLAFSREFTSERARLERAAARCEKRLAELEDAPAHGDERHQIAERYLALERLDRETVDAMVDYVSVSRRVSGTRVVPIEIHWNF